MNIEDIIGDLKKHYNDTIKPYIEKGHFLTAGCEMRNLIWGVIQPNADEINKYHSGPTFISFAELLKEGLLNPEKNPEPAVEMFEAYMAQLELSIKSGNVFEI